MATFFGEVRLNPSRAYDEYEDELLPERYEVEILLNLKKKLVPSSLIVSYGFLANDFMEGCIHNEHCESVGKIHPKKLSQEDRIDTGDFHPRALKSCPLFLTTKGTLLCQISEDITPKLAVKLAKNILSLIEKSCLVMVLSSHHASKLNFTSDNILDKRCHIFSIVSSNCNSASLFAPLPQPSVLDSLPAAIMTECLIQERPCIIFAAFTETSSPGDVDLVVHDFLKAISLPPFLDSVFYDKKYTTTTNRTDMVDRYM